MNPQLMTDDAGSDSSTNSCEYENGVAATASFIKPSKKDLKKKKSNLLCTGRRSKNLINCYAFKSRINDVGKD